MEARTACELVITRSEELKNVLVRRRFLREVAYEYARSFLAGLLSSIPPRAPWPTDIKITRCTYDAVEQSTTEGVQSSSV